MNGKVAKCDHREYGFAQVQISKIGGAGGADRLFEGLGEEMQVCVCDVLLFQISHLMKHYFETGLDVTW